MGRLTIGVDLGQAQDPTAVAVAEKTALETHIRHLDRLPLGTPYPRVCEAISGLCAALPDARLVVDGTGVGRAVVDALEDAGLEPFAIFITAGKETRREGQRFWMPKADLLRPLIESLASGTLKIASGLDHADALQTELKAFQVRRGERGHLAFEGKGAHDDLVIAVTLSLFHA